MTNPDKEEVRGIYDRADELRREAQKTASQVKQRSQKTAPQMRRVNRTLMLLMGSGMVLYGLIAMGIKIASSSVAPPQTPSAGIVTSTQTVNTCEAALGSLDELEVRAATEPTQGLNVKEAERTADNLLYQYLQFNRSTYPMLLGGPALVDIRLPDRTSHQAWARIWIPEITPDSSDHLEAPEGVSAHVLYISAATGEPILLIKDLTVQDPLLAGCGETVAHEFFENIERSFQSLGRLVLNIALLAIGTVVLAYWQRSR
ncbi:MAG: hypothetical protein JXB30_15220 [Anaerolineae bacterium]|nr:hypothetical protein [Anaerolineae bacterium]